MPWSVDSLEKIERKLILSAGAVPFFPITYFFLFVLFSISFHLSRFFYYSKLEQTLREMESIEVRITHNRQSSTSADEDRSAG